MSSSWDRVAEALLGGAVVQIAGHEAGTITGRLSGRSAIKRHWRVNVRTTPSGVVAWLTKKEDR